MIDILSGGRRLTMAKGGLNSFHIKLIGCLSMLADHIGVLLLPEADILRIVGRLAFPIFAFGVAEGYGHTRSLGRYLLRLALFAAGFEPIYRLCMGREWNIFFTLLAGLAAISLWEGLGRKSGSRIPGGLAIGAILALAWYFRFDYGPYGPAIILTAHWFKEDWRKLLISWALLTLAYSLAQLPLLSYQFFGLLALALLAVYNGEKGPATRWLFYGFYCLHIPALYGLSRVLGGL